MKTSELSKSPGSAPVHFVQGTTITGFHKDRVLDELAALGNVAQFVSFAPAPHGRLVQRYCRVAGFEANHVFASPRDAIECLLRNSADGSINLRSFEPARPQSRDFHYGIKCSAEAVTLAGSLAERGLYVIANETIDVSDGGVSGVIQGGVPGALTRHKPDNDRDHG